MSYYKRIPLIAKLILAVALGIILGSTLPTALIRGFVTFSSIFSSFLGFTIPLIIVGFIVPGISQVSNNAGKLLGLSTGVAYISTIIAGTFAFLTAKAVLPKILANATLQTFKNPEDLMLKPFIEFKMTLIHLRNWDFCNTIRRIKTRIRRLRRNYRKITCYSNYSTSSFLHPRCIHEHYRFWWSI